MYSYHLPENPTAEQVQKVVAAIGHAAGPTIMSAVAGSFGKLALKVNGHDVTDKMPLTVAALEAQREVPPPPPANLVPPPPLPVELDASNMPWDVRIHAATQTQNKDGSWKAKKNLDDTVKMQVTAELRAQYPAPALPAPATPVAPPPPASASVVPPPPPVAGVADLSTFAGVMAKTSGLIAASKVTREQVTAAAQAVGVPNTIALATRPDLWAGYAATLDAYALGA